MDWFEIKAWLQELSGLDRDSLHIYGTVGIQLLTALIIRRPLASIWPWLAALIAALANEYADLSQFDSWEAAPDHFKAAVTLDMWNGMALPTVLMIFARFFPGSTVFKPKNQTIENEVDQESESL